MHFILNGKEVANPSNSLIRSEDRLLVVYGNESPENLQQEFDSVSRNAGEYNNKYDPGSCG